MNELYGNYRNLKFSDVWNEAYKFVNDYESICVSKMGIDTATFAREDAESLYYLLYSKYGNSTVASSDITQFKFKLFAIVFAAAPSWRKKLDIQRKILKLSDEEIVKGAKTIYNHAFNPSTAPSTASLEELTKIDDQNTTNYKKSPLEGYSTLIELLRDDVTGMFLNRFKNLFLTFVNPEQPLWYVSEGE